MLSKTQQKKLKTESTKESNRTIWRANKKATAASSLKEDIESATQPLHSIMENPVTAIDRLIDHEISAASSGTTSLAMQVSALQTQVNAMEAANTKTQALLEQLSSKLNG